MTFFAERPTSKGFIRRRPSRWLALQIAPLTGVLGFLSILPAAAVAMTLVGGIQTVEADGWLAQELSWSIRPGAQSSLKVGQLTISKMPETLSDISLICPRLTLLTDGGDCQGGLLSARYGDQLVSGSWQASRSSQGTQGTVSVALAGGEVTLRLDPLSAVALEVTGVQLETLAALISVQIPEPLRSPQAILDLQLNYTQAGAGSGSPEQGLVNGRWRISGLSFDSADGTLAGAELSLSGQITAELADAMLTNFSASATVHDGELLVDPVYVSFTETPDLQLTFNGSRLSNGAIEVEGWRLTDRDALELAGTATLNPDGSLDDASIALNKLLLALAWPRYLSAVSDAMGLKGLSAEGQLKAQLDMVDGAVAHLSLAAEQLSMSTASDRLGISKLDGIVDYSPSGDSADSSLSWDALSYYTLVIGPASSRFFLGGGQVQLLEPLFLPVLDGGLRVDELVVDNLGTDQTAMDFRGELLPMALDQITRALDWPELKGTLSGSIPKVQLRGEVVEVGGTVLINVFGGQVAMNQLKLERIFGVLPTLTADVQVAGVDLEQMTGAFSFGKIEGVLMGSVRGLRLLDWRPVAFDLNLRTDPDGSVRQRISQRAVDNLSSIGGGVGALGSSVLRIFDDFGYRQLGLSCVLRNNTCTMGGVGDTGAGYYLVRGSGIPRIDIKGFSRRVDWPQLVRRLKAATETGPVSVE